MWKQWSWAIALVLVAGTAFALDRDAVMKQVESSMLVTGTIDIAASGKVEKYSLDQQEKLPPGVVKLIAGNLPTWEFVPEEGESGPVAARSKMSLLVVAKKLDKDQFKLRIRSANFEDATPAAEGTVVSPKQMTPPKYPEQAMYMGANGIVYLLLRINRQGKVEDVVAEQVNLRVIGTDAQMQQARDLLAKNAIKTARKWTFNAPTTGENAEEEEFWTARVPINYALWGVRTGRAAAYGDWETYIPGPRLQTPWKMQMEEIDPSFTPDALAAGGIYQAGRGPRLRTPLDRS